MAGTWKRMAVYLGLAEDDYDDYDDAPAEQNARDRGPARSGYRGADLEDEGSNVRRINPARPSESSPAPAAMPNEVSGQVHLTEPTTFNDIEEVGDRFRNGIPVIMNLGGANESVAKRLLDFASGLIYGLDGRIERVGDRVFLLTPVGVDVSTEERRKLTERGFFNQA